MNTTAEITAATIAQALILHDGNQSKAAAELGLNRRTFGRRLDAHRDEVEQILNGSPAAGDTESAPGEPEVTAEPGITPAPEPEATAEPEPAAAPEPAALAAARSPKGKNAGKAQDEKPAPAYFPAGHVTPVQFRHLLVREGLAAESLTTQDVYSWLTGRTFPAVYVTEDGTVHDAPVKTDGKLVTKAAVPVRDARTWFAARQARIAARAAGTVKAA